MSGLRISDISVEKGLELHRELWNWLSENPRADKEDWPGWERFSDEDQDTMNYDYSLCFACLLSNCDCGNGGCVLEWPGLNCCTAGTGDDNNDGLYLQWEKSRYIMGPWGEKRSELARQIRDLPARTERKKD